MAVCCMFLWSPSDFRLSPFHGVKIKNIELVMVLLTIIATYSKSSSRPSPPGKTRNSWNLRITQFHGCKGPQGSETHMANSRMVVKSWCVFLLGGQILNTWRNSRANVLGLFIVTSWSGEWRNIIKEIYRWVHSSYSRWWIAQISNPPFFSLLSWCLAVSCIKKLFGFRCLSNWPLPGWNRALGCIKP